MKKFLLVFLTLANVLTSFAQLNGDGFYRIQNVGSSRYLYVKDDKGSVNIGTTSADMGAIELWKGYENAVTDPSSILHIRHVSGNSYRFHSQGTDSYEIIGYDLLISKNRDGSYKAYQKKSGMVVYLCDAERSSVPDGYMGQNDNGTNYRNWNIVPVDNQNQVLGVAPEFEVLDGKYATIYAEFPFTLTPGMEAYYIREVDSGMAILAPIKDGKVPAATPVIIKCMSNDPLTNKLKIGENQAPKIYDSKLGGVYFHNTKRSHRNLTPYKPETMRVLGVTKENKIGFVKANIQNLPANKAFLKVHKNAPDELRIVTQKEYDDIIASGIGDITMDAQNDERIYTISGTLVGEGYDEFQLLPAGFYIVGGKKIIKK